MNYMKCQVYNDYDHDWNDLVSATGNKSVALNDSYQCKHTYVQIYV